MVMNRKHPRQVAVLVSDKAIPAKRGTLLLGKAIAAVFRRSAAVFVFALSSPSVVLRVAIGIR